MSPEGRRSGDRPGSDDSTPWIGSFSEGRKGRQALTSQEHIGVHLVDSRRAYAALYGTILGEYTEGTTNTPMFLVDYGEPWVQFLIA